MTLSKQLKTYITERFKLNYQETWACETIDAGLKMYYLKNILKIVHLNIKF